jgi:guanine nucleotide-binding protein subunit alpha, other
MKGNMGALVSSSNTAPPQVHLPIIMEEKDLNPFEPIPSEYLRAFKDLWRDGGVQQAFERGNEYALHDNLG